MKANPFFALVFFILMATIYCQGQTMTLTFTAEHDGSHVALDSISIENLTQGGDTALFAPDTVLVLDYLTSTEEINIDRNDGLFVSQNYPNPFTDKTSFRVEIREKSINTITIHDIYGREIIQSIRELDAGIHYFEFYSGKAGQYILSVRNNKGQSSIKMLNLNSSSSRGSDISLDYKSYEKLEFSQKLYSSNHFPYSLGDYLKFTGYTAWGLATILDDPMTNQTYSFHYTGNSCPGIPIVTDIDGNDYNTVLIGSQCWMVENLKTTTYNNGTPIPYLTKSGSSSKINTGAYGWYDNNTLNKDTYGALYNWYAVMDPNGLCPEGWHVPDNDDWNVLTDLVGGTASPNGNKLKSCRQINSPLGGDCNTSDHPRWADHGTHYGTDDFGFSALPGGTWNYFGTFVTQGYHGSFWSSTESSSNYGWLYGLEYNNGFIDVYGFYKENAYPVRCVKD